ncbi:hypothetical protein WME91_28910 [Sorangium sp. So ce269]
MTALTQPHLLVAGRLGAALSLITAASATSEVLHGGMHRILRLDRIPQMRP